MGRRLQKRRLSNRNLELSDRQQQQQLHELQQGGSESPESGSTENLSLDGFIPRPFRPPFADEDRMSEVSRNGSLSTLGLPKSGFPSVDHLARSEVNLLNQKPSRSDITLTEEENKKRISETTDDSEEEDKDGKEGKKTSWWKRLNPFHRGAVPPIPRDDAGLVPEMTANWFSKLTWGWISPLMMKGYRRPLQKEDLWRYDDARLTHNLAEKLKANIEKRRKRGANKYLLLAALNETFFWTFWMAGIIKVIGDTANALSPLAMRKLVQFANEAYVANQSNQPGPDIWWGIGWAFGLSGLQLVATLGLHHFNYRAMMCGAMSRSALASVIYQKSLKLSNKARIEYPNGKITNLMSTDASRVDYGAEYFHQSWTSVIQMCVILVVLLINIGYSALAGFGLLVVCGPVLGKVIRQLHTKRRKSTKFTDARVRLMQEILGSMRAIKFYTWETPFLKRVAEIRKSELKIVKYLLLLKAGINAVSLSIPIYASILAFTTYSVVGNTLEPAKIFSSLTLFNLMRNPLMYLPKVISASIDAWVALGRMQSMLLAEELESPNVDPDAAYAVEVWGGRFVWEAEERPTTAKPPPRKWWRRKRKGQSVVNSRLSTVSARSGDTKRRSQRFSRNLDAQDIGFALQVGGNSGFQIQHGEFVVIVGEIGAGKSSLLAALVGEMRRTDGILTLGGKVAFCPQTAWIQNATVKDNILFGQEYDKEKYDQVIHDCALEQDIDMLPGGDLTEIGERGVTLSGGQKARINIARAAYSNVDIYLLDDPLSAVDAHVGRHLIEECICGLMAGKTRILVTHQLHVLPHADRIFYMHDGKILEEGTYSELIENGEDFARLVEKFGGKEEEKPEAPAEHEGPKPPMRKRRSVLMGAEERATGSVPRSVYFEYARAGGGFWIIPAIVAAVILSNGGNLAMSIWLSAWTSHRFPVSENAYIAGYAALGFSQGFFLFVYAFTLTSTGNRATRKMHDNALNRIIRAPMSFFDKTPLGRIINRFSKDVDLMDNKVSESYRTFLQSFTQIITVLILIIVYFQWFGVALLPLMVGFWLAAMFYTATAREVKRLDAILRSHVYAHFGETLTGLMTVRAYGKQYEFSRITERALDVMNRAYYITIVNQRWLGIRLNFVGNALIFVVSMLVCTSRFSVSPSISGMILSYCIQIVSVMGQLTRQYAEMQNNMNATERVHYYATHIENEAPHELPDRKPPPPWPAKGEIVMKDVAMRYADGMPLVLKNVTMHIDGGERIGIVGRTGAGKSSIMVALFRLAELSRGSITIDGVDVSQIGLHDLRKSLAIIPQDPVLFQGTIRANLDPFNQHDDVELWEALRRVHLLDGPETPEWEDTRFHLDEQVGDEGLNFSLGQRQLLAMARALVQRARIIVMDEATSSVDFETDEQIQLTIKQEFKDATLLTIAHRLRTIIDYDKIAVMSDGVVAEFDTPLNLYDNKHSVFYSLCEQSGINREDIIHAGRETGKNEGAEFTLPDEDEALGSDEMREIFTPWIRAWMNL